MLYGNKFVVNLIGNTYLLCNYFLHDLVTDDKNILNNITPPAIDPNVIKFTLFLLSMKSSNFTSIFSSINVNPSFSLLLNGIHLISVLLFAKLILYLISSRVL